MYEAEVLSVLWAGSSVGGMPPGKRSCPPLGRLAGTVATIPTVPMGLAVATEVTCAIGRGEATAGAGVGAAVFMRM